MWFTIWDAARFHKPVPGPGERRINRPLFKELSGSKWYICQLFILSLHCMLWTSRCLYKFVQVILTRFSLLLCCCRKQKMSSAASVVPRSQHRNGPSRRCQSKYDHFHFFFLFSASVNLWSDPLSFIFSSSQCPDPAATEIQVQLSLWPKEGENINQHIPGAGSEVRVLTCRSMYNIIPLTASCTRYKDFLKTFYDVMVYYLMCLHVLLTCWNFFSLQIPTQYSLVSIISHLGGSVDCGKYQVWSAAQLF